MNRVYNHKDKSNVAETCFSLEIYKLITIGSCKEKSESKLTLLQLGEAQKLKMNFMSLKKTGQKAPVLFSWSFLIIT